MTYTVSSGTLNSTPSIRVETYRNVKCKLTYYIYRQQKYWNRPHYDTLHAMRPSDRLLNCLAARSSLPVCFAGSRNVSESLVDHGYEGRRSAHETNSIRTNSVRIAGSIKHARHPSRRRCERSNKQAVAPMSSETICRRAFWPLPVVERTRRPVGSTSSMGLPISVL